MNKAVSFDYQSSLTKRDPREEMQSGLHHLDTNDEIEVLGFDLDGTLISNNTWELMHEAVGIPAEQDWEWYQQFLSGQLTYSQWLKLIEEAYIERGVTRQMIEGVFAKIELTEGCQEVIDKLKNKFRLAIVSSSVDLIVQYVASKLNITQWKSNCHLIFDKHDKLVRIDWDDSEEIAKIDHIFEISERVKCPVQKWAFVGNSYNDLPALSLVKLGILYWQKPVLPENVGPDWIIIKRFSELEALLDRKVIDL